MLRVLWSIVMGVVVGDLPSESTLPGQAPPVPAPSQPTRPLPAESQLPLTNTPAGNARPTNPRPVENKPVENKPVENKPVENKPVAPPTRVAIPSEAQLPTGFVVDSKPLLAVDLLSLTAGVSDESSDASLSDLPGDSQVPERKPMADQPAGGPAPGQTPWLRLNMHGQVGVVRALGYTTDGERLCAGGDDKTVEVWTRWGKPGGDEVENRRWVHERAIRWPVERGPRGRIQAIAAAPGALAFAGYGILGGVGEIWLVDPVSGELKRTLRDDELGHRQVVAGVAFPSGRADLLVSQDLAGRVMLWKQDRESGLWSGKQLRNTDREVLGSEDAAKLQIWRRAAPLALLDAQQLIVPRFQGWRTIPNRTDAIPEWTLEVLNVETGESRLLDADTRHLGGVFTIAASPNRKKVASSDAVGNLIFWNVRDGGAVSRRQDIAISAATWLADSDSLVVGSARSPKRGNQAAWQHWNAQEVLQPELVREQPLPEDVLAIAAHPQRSEVAITQGAEVVVERFELAPTPAERLRGLARPVLRIEFAAADPPYRIALGTKVSRDGTIPLEQSFDLQQVQLAGAAEFPEKDWLDDQAWQGEWKLQTERSANDETYWLYRGEQKGARLPLSPRLHGRPSATCWIPDEAGKPLAVAVGTSLQGNIFVFRLAETGTATVLRQFRGHEGGVRCLAVSRDRRYLGSGSDDATARIWNLADFDQASVSVNRWGAEFDVRDGVLVATQVQEASRLYFRGIREGDRVHSMAWKQEGAVKQSDRPAEMLQQLRTATWDTQLVFDCRRRDLQLDGFQQLPAWQPLASLYVTPGREWAFWTPAGYYDASFDGHKLFGWQVNRGVDLAPEFFLAAQFRQALERPTVMQRLLNRGSVASALRDTDPAPDAGQDAVLPQIELKPRVEILEPRPQELVTQPRVMIRAKVTIGTGLQLLPPKAFCNGVVASERRQLEEREIPGGREFLYEWNAGVPADEMVMVQVIAATDAEVAETQTVTIRHEVASAPSRRIYLVAAGVNEYRDAQIQRLDFAAENARRVAQEWRGQSPLVDATTLVDGQATRAIWNVVTTEYASRLEREAAPNDLLVFFLSGHGVRDEQTGKYYFVAADARFDDVKSRRFADCLSFEDFAAFARVPCRKLVVLDTCHAGAVQQPLQQQDLKSAIRSLQDDVVFTLTASEGTQEAAEDRSRQLGRFTARLIEALQGAADEAQRGGDQDGLVTLNEARDYVRATVAADSARDAAPQHPTAGPIDLLEFARFPLTIPKSQ